MPVARVQHRPERRPAVLARAGIRRATVIERQCREMRSLQLSHRFKCIIQIELSVAPFPVGIFHCLRAHRPEDQEAFDLEGINSRNFLYVKEPFQHERHSAGRDGG